MSNNVKFDIIEFPLDYLKRNRRKYNKNWRQ